MKTKNKKEDWLKDGIPNTNYIRNTILQLFVTGTPNLLSHSVGTKKRTTVSSQSAI